MPWQYKVLERSRHSWDARELQRELDRLGAENWQLVTDFAGDLILIRPVAAPPPPTTTAIAMVFTIRTGADAMGTVLTINSTDGLADVQFVDSDNDKVEGPLDSVLNTPIAPEFASDNPVLAIAAATEDPAQVGHWTAVLSEAGAGSANVSVAALTNSDGSAVNEPEGTPNAGQPFAVPDPVNVTVNPGAAVGEVFTVTGN